MGGISPRAKPPARGILGTWIGARTCAEVVETLNGALHEALAEQSARENPLDLLLAALVAATGSRVVR